MTGQQKDIIKKLLQGYNIAVYGPGNIRLRDERHNSCQRVHSRTFYWLKRNVLRKTAHGLFVINKSKVRQLHGNSVTKRLYKSMLRNKCKKCIYPGIQKVKI